MKTRDAIFLHKDVQELLRHKTVIVLGDSIQRSVYKDLVCLWSDPQSRYVANQELKIKGELSFRQDKLLRGGDLAEKTNGTDYKEEREFRQGDTLFRYYFITRCWDAYIESVFQNHLTAEVHPHVIIVNSCYWDIHRYGDEGKKLYEVNMNKLFTAISRLSCKPLLVWNSALPLADYCKGGFFRKGFNTLTRHEIDWANNIARALTEKYRFIYVDLFDSIRQHHMFAQAEDGIHWSNKAHRNMSNSILAVIGDCWGYNVIEKVPSPLFPTPPVTPVLYNHDWSPRYDVLNHDDSGYDDYHHNNSYGFNQYYHDGIYDDNNYTAVTPPRPAMPVLPGITHPFFLTPSPRYHPYVTPPMMESIRYFSPVMGRPREHRRSYTDPFPQQPSHLHQIKKNNRSRFKGMTNYYSTTPLRPVQARNRATPVRARNLVPVNPVNARSPLRECNGSVTPGANNTPLVPKQANSATSDDKKEQECSDNQSSVDSSHKEVCPGNTPGTSGISKTCTTSCPENNPGTSSGISQTCTTPEPLKVVSDLTERSEEVGEGSVVSNDVMKSDINNNESNSKVVNGRKRKRENESDEEEEEKPEKVTKLA